MRSSARRFPTALRIGAGALVWLIAICWAHWGLNVGGEDRRLLRMGYMPVITNLAAPLLDHASRSGSGLRFEAVKFSSFADMAAALRDGYIDAGFMIAPLAIVLRQQGASMKVVSIGNRHESTLVVRKELRARSVRDLAGLTVAIPMRYSGHNVALRQLAEEAGLRDGDIKIVEMNPPDMGAALQTGELDAYFVGEPFAALTVRSGDAAVLHYVEEFWPGFICNLVVVDESLIDTRPHDVELLVEGAARAGYWARKAPGEASQIVAEYWNQSADLAEYALDTPEDRIVYTRFVPKLEEMQELADRMVHFGLLESNDVSGLVEDRFALQADLEDIGGLATILRPEAVVARR